MKDINVRYGASLELLVTIADVLADEATLYVGLAGQVPILTKTASFTDGAADLSLDPEDTEIELGTYSYQVNVSYTDGRLDKFPTADSCGENGFPTFKVIEALDEQETS